MWTCLGELRRTNSTPTVTSLRLLSGRIPTHFTSPNSGPLSLIQTIRSFSFRFEFSITSLSSRYKGKSSWIGMERSGYWRRYTESWSFRTLWMAAKIALFCSQVKNRFFRNTPSQVPLPLLSCRIIKDFLFYLWYKLRYLHVRSIKNQFSTLNKMFNVFKSKGTILNNFNWTLMKFWQSHSLSLCSNFFFFYL